MARHDVSVICQNTCQLSPQQIYDGVDSEYAFDREAHYDSLRVYKRRPGEDGRQVWHECQSVFARYADFVKFSESISTTGKGYIQCEDRNVPKGSPPLKVTVSSGDSALYLLDLRVQKSSSLSKLYGEGHKLVGFHPGHDCCLTRFVSCHDSRSPNECVSASFRDCIVSTYLSLYPSPPSLSSCQRNTAPIGGLTSTWLKASAASGRLFFGWKLISPILHTLPGFVSIVLPSPHPI